MAICIESVIASLFCVAICLFRHGKCLFWERCRSEPAMVGCESKGAGRSHSDLQGFFPL